MRTSEAFAFYGILNICSAWYWAMPGEACRWGTGADDDLRDRGVIVAFEEDFPFQPGQFLTITSRGRTARDENEIYRLHSSLPGAAQQHLGAAGAGIAETLHVR